MSLEQQPEVSSDALCRDCLYAWQPAQTAIESDPVAEPDTAALGKTETDAGAMRASGQKSIAEARPRDASQPPKQADEGSNANLTCPKCASTRTITHEELHILSIAHIDCDAFYASVEKRDNPALHGKPVIIGGGRRGVVAAACYVARMYGVRSAMPMFKALKACPDAVVIKPNMEKYSRAGRAVRELMLSATPLVQPLSIDEAFLDLSGTENLHGQSPASTLAGLIKKIETDIGVTASVGLSYNKFLAKIASDLDKPRGFAIVGEAEALDFLASKPVSIIFGVGRALERTLHQDGIATIGQLRDIDQKTLLRRYGAMGGRLYEFAWGRDERPVNPNSETKSISSETTFEEDLGELYPLARILWPQCEAVSRRLKKKDFAAGTVQLKLRTSDFRIISRSRKLSIPTQTAAFLFQTALELLEREIDGTKYRLLGVGGADLTEGANADLPDLADPDRDKAARVERVMDEIRAKLGNTAVLKGRSLDK